MTVFLLPTDTCYGLAGNFTREDFDAINQMKWRDNTKRLALLVADFDDMKKYVEIRDEQIEFLKQYPHPWSFLVVRHPRFTVPEWMDPSKYEKLSLRVASVCVPHYWSRMRDLSLPLFLTSANLSGHPESRTLEEAKKYFPHLDGIDGGLCDRPPSDIFSLGEDGEILYLRRNYEKTPE